MGCDYWKTIDIVIEYMENHKLITIEKEFSIESCNFYYIKINSDDRTSERTHRLKVIECLKATPIPEPITLFYNGIWNADYIIHKERAEFITKDIFNIRRILLKTSYQIC